jgi:peptide/nickel transport system substrate-binding protein/oligopeptide transport system substrate-binding protein
MDSIRTENDISRRVPIYRQAERMVVDDAAWIPLFHAKKYELVKPYVQGYSPTPMTIPYLAGVSIERK